MDNDTLFYYYAKRGGHTPQQRAENVANEILGLGKHFNLQPDSLYIETSEIVTDLMYGDKVINSFITFSDCLKLDFGAVFFYDVNAEKPK